MFVTTLKNGDVLLSVYVQPKSSKNKISSIFDESVKICITAPPVDGEANKAISLFLASFFNISKKNIQIVSGMRSRRKMFVLVQLTEEEVRKRVWAEIDGQI